MISRIKKQYRRAEEAINNNRSILIPGFALILSAVNFIFGFGNNTTEKLLVSLALISVALLIVALLLRREKQNLAEKIEEQREYNGIIDEKYTLPVEVNNKAMEVDITENGDDRVTYTHKISPKNNNKIETFYGLIGTNKEVRWEDLNPEVQNGKIEEHHRRDREEFSRFILTMSLYEIISPSGTTEISYTVEHDVVDAKEDHSYLIIRHETTETNFELTFPEEFDVKKATAKQDEPNDVDTKLYEPEIEQEDGQDKILWNCSDVSLGDRYRIDWIAEK